MEVIHEIPQAVAMTIRLGNENVLVTTGKPDREPVKIETGNTPFAKWGDDNLRPQYLIEKAERSSLIPSILDFKNRLIYSQGLAYGFEKYENGEKKLIRVYIKEIEEFFNHVKINRYLREAADDSNLLNNHFVKIRKTVGGDIIDIGSVDAAFCRLQLQDKTDGHIKGCYVNANWDRNPSAIDGEPFLALDPYYDVAGQIKRSRKLDMIIPMRLQRRGRIYYDKAPWEGVLESGWYDLHMSVPNFKKSLMENQLSIKWHIQIPASYWQIRFPEWNSWTEKKQQAGRKQVLDNFIDFLKGTAAAGMAFMSEYMDGPGQENYPGWKVEALKGDFKGGEYVEDSREADFIITRAFGVSGQLIQSPLKGQSSGSGSDIRVAFNQAILMEKPRQDHILEPVMELAAHEDWTNRFKNELEGNPFKVWNESYYLATLDQVSNENRM